MGKRKVKDILNEEDNREYERYENAVKRDLKISGFSEETQKEILNSLLYHYEMLLVTNRLAYDINVLIDQQEKKIEEVDNEKNDRKKKEINQRVQKTEGKSKRFKNGEKRVLR